MKVSEATKLGAEHINRTEDDCALSYKNVPLTPTATLGFYKITEGAMIQLGCYDLDYPDSSE